MVVYQGIEKTVVRGVANESLRKIMLVAIAHDITISAKWIPGDSNGLADALSRFQAAATHQFCPYWATAEANEFLIGTVNPTDYLQRL